MDVVLYTRRGCRLCEGAEDLLLALAPAARLVEVSDDPDLESLFGSRVPVLSVGGRVVAEGRIDEAAMAAALVTIRD